MVVLGFGLLDFKAMHLSIKLNYLCSLRGHTASIPSFAPLQKGSQELYLSSAFYIANLYSAARLTVLLFSHTLKRVQLKTYCNYCQHSLRDIVQC